LKRTFICDSDYDNLEQNKAIFIPFFLLKFEMINAHRSILFVFYEIFPLFSKHPNAVI